MQSPANPYVRDPKQPVDEAYTKKIKEYTTEPFFTSPLVDYLPASKTVPTPKAVLGDIAGAPGQAALLARGLPVHADGREGQPAREGVLDRQDRRRARDDRGRGRRRKRTSAKLDENRARLAKLADPRTISMNDAEADKLVDQSVPVYYITGAIHSPETGSPTALMELAYRLAVDESPYIQKIRSRIVTLDHADRRSRRPRSPGRHLPLAPRQSRARTGRRSSTGASTSRTTTTATRWR